MNKKGSMELSVNSIVILVIAIVMLGLILGFVKSKFSDLDKQFVDNEPDAPPATSSTPITVSRTQLIVNPGEQLGLKFQVYALTDVDGTSTSTDGPVITCDSGAWTVDVNPKEALEGEGKVLSYEGIVRVPTSMSKGKQLCALTFSAAADSSPSVYPSVDLVVEVR